MFCVCLYIVDNMVHFDVYIPYVCGRVCVCV